MHRLSRRTFLSGLAAGAAAAACGSGRSPVPAASPEALQVFTTSIEHVVGDRRLAFAVFDGQRPLRGSRGAGTVTLRGEGGATAHDLRAFTIVKGTGGAAADAAEGPGDVIFVAQDLAFETGGFYEARAEVTIDGRDHVATGRVGVADRAVTLGPGAEAVATPTPTTQDARGADPICTRDPQCTQHSASLDAALRTGRPVVVSFGTPALCTSRMCGPVLDNVESAKQAAGEGVEFVHVEIYTTLDSRQPLDAVKAWRIVDSGEPFTFFVGRDGKVVERMSGPVGEWEIREGLDRVRA